jgi:hypothetical protein
MQPGVCDGQLRTGEKGWSAIPAVGLARESRWLKDVNNFKPDVSQQFTPLKSSLRKAVQINEEWNIL